MKRQTHIIEKKVSRPKNFDYCYNQFYQEYEEESECSKDDDEGDFANKMEAMMLEPSSQNTVKNADYHDSTDVYFTTVGHINGQDIITNLANQSFTHALPDNNHISPPKESEVFFQTQRYGNKKFYGIMIDTGATMWSTAGYNQNLVYISLSSVTLDPSTAGQASLRFGIGSATSVGSVLVSRAAPWLCCG
ncbi:hypothetical protein K3495_g3871 [Podosphaera aphanis]|nr:hypothetical protein K3495_g3871 [Podosphaera aphanis]